MKPRPPLLAWAAPSATTQLRDMLHARPALVAITQRARPMLPFPRPCASVAVPGNIPQPRGRGPRPRASDAAPTHMRPRGRVHAGLARPGYGPMRHHLRAPAALRGFTLRRRVRPRARPALRAFIHRHPLLVALPNVRMAILPTLRRAAAWSALLETTRPAAPSLSAALPAPRRGTL